MKVSVFMDDIWDFIAMINNSLHFRFSIIAMKKEIIFSVLPFMSLIILFKHDPQSLNSYESYHMNKHSYDQ